MVRVVGLELALNQNSQKKTGGNQILNLFVDLLLKLRRKEVNNLNIFTPMAVMMRAC